MARSLPCLVAALSVCLVSFAEATLFPETGDEMTWGQANYAFAHNSMDRDYARLSSSLDAADQFAGFRANNGLTRGVPFSKAPDLSFQGFAMGKGDGGLDGRVREMTPYLAASAFQNNLRQPLHNHVIYPQVAAPSTLTAAYPYGNPLNIADINHKMAESKINTEDIASSTPALLQSGARASPGMELRDLEQFTHDVQHFANHGAPGVPSALQQRQDAQMQRIAMGANPYSMANPYMAAGPLGQAHTLPGGLTPLMPPWAPF